MYCVFACQVWAEVFEQTGAANSHPNSWGFPDSPACGAKLSSVPKEMRKGLNSLIILVAWEIWKHCNFVFEGSRPRIEAILISVAYECALCVMGASALEELLLRWLTPEGYTW